MDTEPPESHRYPFPRQPSHPLFHRDLTVSSPLPRYLTLTHLARALHQRELALSESDSEVVPTAPPGTPTRTRTLYSSSTPIRVHALKAVIARLDRTRQLTLVDSGPDHLLRSIRLQPDGNYQLDSVYDPSFSGTLFDALTELSES